MKTDDQLDYIRRFWHGDWELEEFDDRACFLLRFQNAEHYFEGKNRHEVIAKAYALVMLSELNEQSDTPLPFGMLGQRWEKTC